MGAPESEKTALRAAPRKTALSAVPRKTALSAVPRKTALSAVAIAVTMLLAACAAGPGWENPNRSRDHWSSDITTCQRWAANRVEKEELQRNSYGTSTLTKGDEFAAQMEKVQRLKRQTSLFGSCMQDRGYRQGTTTPLN